MISDQQRFQDRWDGMVSIECQTCKAIFRLEQTIAERFEVSRCPKCGVPPDYPPPRRRATVLRGR